MSPSAPDVLRTTVGDLPLEEIQLDLGGRTWSILHTGAVISREQEVAFLTGDGTTLRPYGIVLWPAAIALACALASRPLAGKRILELGAGTGLPGLVAASLGAHVVQTDRHHLALHVCKQNAERNGIAAIEHGIADWTSWDDAAHYDLILGSDILYAEAAHAHLRHIFDTNLGPHGTVVVSDPFRETSMRLVEAMAAEGWRVAIEKWTVGVVPPPRPVGVFALTRPGPVTAGAR